MGLPLISTPPPQSCGMQKGCPPQGWVGKRAEKVRGVEQEFTHCVVSEAVLAFRQLWVHIRSIDQGRVWALVGKEFDPFHRQPGS